MVTVIIFFSCYYATLVYWKSSKTHQKSLLDVAQLVSALPSVLEVLSPILSDSTVCFNFPLICVALALDLDTRKTEQ